MDNRSSSPTTWVVNTRARAQAGEFSQILETAGFSVLEFPCLELLSEPSAQLAAELHGAVAPGCWLLLTSANAVAALPADFGIDDVRIACLAEKTAQAARDRGFIVHFVGTGGTAEAFACELLKVWGSSVVGLYAVVVRGDIAAPELPAELVAHGAIVREVVAYRSVLPPVEAQTAAQLAEVLRAGDRVLLTFSSSQALRNWRELSLANPDLQPWFEVLLAKAVVVIGPKTAQTAGKLGFSRIATAAAPTIEAMLEAVRVEVANR